MMPQWRQIAAQLPSTFLRRSSKACFLLLELQTFVPPPPPPPAPAVLKYNNHLQLLAEDTVGAPPREQLGTGKSIHGCSSEPDKTPVNHLYSLVVFLWVLHPVFYRITHFWRH